MARKNFRDEKAKLLPEPGRIPREDTASVMKFYNLHKGFPKAVRAEAEQLAKENVLPDGRLDLRKKFIFTCDPQSARDFDDALSFEKDRLSRRVLGVHIADVSHYVKPGSAIDKEAFKRSTSVYLADEVLPMLPEELSNGLCSLVPNEDRYAFSVFITFDKHGEVVKTSFAKSIIRSKARLEYAQVMGIILGAEVPGIGKKEAKTIQKINELAKELRAKRFANGALDLEIPEMEVILDGAGEMSGLVARPYDESHQMVEECMVAANEAVAKELWTHGVKILSRFHDAPEAEKLYNLRAELHPLGIKTGNLENRKVFAQFLQKIKSSPLYPTVALMVLRSMKRAVYDSKEMGHWGLAKRFYSHFTSPIRRYPDLTLHRQLAAYLEKDVANYKIGAAVLAKWAKHTSEMEERAAEAERALLEIKKYRLLEEEIISHTKVEYEGIISKCEKFGCFVDIQELAVSGLVHISMLAPGYVKYNYNDHSLSMPGGRSWHIGDSLRVKIASVDYKNRRLDFVPADYLERAQNNRFDRKQKYSKSENSTEENDGKRKNRKMKFYNNSHKGKRKHGTNRTH